MKQQVRVGILASLLMAPAVLASANEQVNQENMNPEGIVEQAAVVHPLAVIPTGDEGTAAPQEIDENASSVSVEVNQEATRAVMSAGASAVPTVAAAPVAQVSNAAGSVAVNVAVNPVFAITDVRINELKGLGEKTLSYDYTKYNAWIKELKDAGDLTSNQADFLDAKATYLRDFNILKNKAKLINDEIKLLKPTNGNTIEIVTDLLAELAPIEEDFKKLRATFDGVYKSYYSSDTAFVTSAATATALPSYHGNIEKFLKDHISNSETLKKFELDIQRPNELIKILENGSISTPTKEEEYLAVLYGYDNHLDNQALVNSGTYADKVQEAYDKFNLYLASKFSATEKQILESHKIRNDSQNRTIKQVIESFKKDLAAAEKVEKLITDIDTGINALTAAQFNSKMKTMITSYEKLTDRQRAMVAGYSTLVDKDNDINDLLGAYEVSSVIAALKPSNKDDYREALYKARKDFNLLNADTQKYVKNEIALVGYEVDLEKAVGEITGFATDGSIQINYTVGGATSAEGLIANISTDTSPPTKGKIEDARKVYDALTANQKKLVNNYKELQDWEKFAKTSLTLIDQIDKIKIEDSKTFASVVQKANTAFEKLTPAQQKLVSNKDRLNALTPYADAVTANNALRISNKLEYREAVRALFDKDASGTITGAVATLTNSLTGDDQIALDKVKASLEKSLDAKLAEILKAEAVEDFIETATTTTPETEKLVAIQKARTAYNDLSANEKKIVTNLKTLTDLEKVAGQPLKVMETINAVDPGHSTFASKAKAAVSAYDKLSSSLKKYIDAPETAKVEDFKTYLAFIDKVKALKSSSPTFSKELKEVEDKLTELSNAGNWAIAKITPLVQAYTDYANELVEAVKLEKTKIETFADAEDRAMVLDGKILTLTGLTDFERFHKLADEIEIEYSQLSADGKKLVKNYKQFQQLKKDSTASHKVIEMISNRVVYMEDVANAGYEKAIANALKAYENLTPSQKRYVYNYSSVLEPQLRIYEVVGMINQLKPTSKTYLDDLNSVRLAYNALSEKDKQKLAPIYYKLTTSEVGVEEVRNVIDLINAAAPGVENYVQKLQEARMAYENLARISPSYQKLVTNYKTLQDREKAIKPVMDSVYQIQELKEFLVRPMNDAAIFVSKYNAAVKAYEKVPYESRELIYNRHDLFNTIYPVASTMEAILKINPNGKTFATDVRKARDWYDALTPKDKALITNYRDLTAYEQVISGGSSVDQMIAAIPRTPATGYMQAIKDARAAYNALLPEEKNAVTLYKELQNYEKGVKNVLDAISAIDSLQHSTNLVSAYDKAQKALDKLTSDERQMVPNMNRLQSVGPAIEVYKQIASLKPGQDGYAGAVQGVYAAYNRLSSVEKQYVTNFAQLQEAKNNVDNLASVISKITSITPGSRDYARQVQEALALYNTLPPAMKKMVPNIEMLNQSQKELTAAQKVRSMISEIDFNSANFVQKTMAARAAYDKLTSNEKRLVSNYFMLEDFEYQLGNMF